MCLPPLIYILTMSFTDGKARLKFQICQWLSWETWARGLIIPNIHIIKILYVNSRHNAWYIVHTTGNVPTVDVQFILSPVQGGKCSLPSQHSQLLAIYMERRATPVKSSLFQRKHTGGICYLVLPNHVFSQCFLYYIWSSTFNIWAKNLLL